jgi:hypothetical protein
MTRNSHLLLPAENANLKKNSLIRQPVRGRRYEDGQDPKLESL